MTSQQQSEDNVMELLGEGKIVNKNGDVINLMEQDLDIIGLYFSAHWCPPCRMFTPQLATRYEELKSSGKKFEIVFISSDRDESSFKDYFVTMPWLALSFKERDGKEKLGAKYGVQGIPTLVLLNKDFTLKTKEGRSEIMKDDILP